MSVSPVIPFRSGLSQTSLSATPSHVAERGDTLQNVAKQHGVEVEALHAANPQVLNVDQPLYPGTVLAVPVPTPREAWSGQNDLMNPDGEPVPRGSSGVDVRGTGTVDGSDATVGGKASWNTTTSSGPEGASSSMDASGSVGGSVSIGDGGITASGSADTDISATTKGGSGVSIHVGAQATVSSTTKTENGKTTYTVTGDVSITAGAGATVKTGSVTAGVDVSHTTGTKTTYEVTMTQETAQSTDPASVNPYDPASMPVGTTVTMKGSDYADTELGGTFGTAAAQISFGNKSYHADGVSTQVEKVGDHQVKVTVGPTEVISHADSLGVSVFGTGVTLGSSFTTNSANLKTATFDLSTPEGQAAYNTFLTTGKLPNGNGSGVSDVAKVAVLDAESKRELSLSLFGYDITATLADSTMNMVQTTYPDGTSQVVTTSDAGGDYGAQLTTTQTIDADGNLVPADTTYTYSLTISNPREAALYETAFGLPHGTVEPGQQLTIRFTQAQMTALQMNVKAKIAQDRDKASHGYGGGGYGRNCQLQTISDNSTDPYMFAARLASRSLCTRLETAALHPADTGMDVLPGTVSVDGAVVKQDPVGQGGGGGRAMLVY